MRVTMRRIIILGIYSVFAGFILITIDSCKHSTANPTDQGSESFNAPLRSLAAEQIMQQEGITSIHYIEYYFTIVNGDSDKSFYPVFEYYIDTARIKMTQYY